MLEAPELGSHVLLAIDTAIGTSVALGIDGRVHEASSDDPRGHAEAIGGLLDEVFRASGASPDAGRARSRV
jgi:tRNA A37 threonylcarbamoyladenosine modification protein TsaB